MTTRVVVPEQVSTGLYDWLKATGDEMETIDGISCVWNDTDEDGPIISIAQSIFRCSVGGDSCHHADSTMRGGQLSLSDKTKLQ